MKQIQLHGVLGEKFGEHWALDVHTPGEALRGIGTNCLGFLPHLLASAQQGVAYRLIVGERDIGTEDFASPTGREVIHLVPVMAGAGGSFGKIFLGAAMIAFGVMSGGASVGVMGALQGAIAGTVSMSTLLGSIAFSVGSSLVLGGVSEMLAGNPKVDAAAASGAAGLASYHFNGPSNTAQQGGPVPVGYGEMIVGAMPVSSGITTEALDGAAAVGGPAGGGIPTLTAFAGVVATVDARVYGPVTFANLTASGNEADVDGTVTAFEVRGVLSGTLKIGANEAAATPWAVGSNDRITSALVAYWLSANSASGNTSAFTVVAVDNDSKESTNETTVQVFVIPYDGGGG